MLTLMRAEPTQLIPIAFRRREPKAVQVRTPNSVTALAPEGIVTALPSWLANDHSWELAPNTARIVVVILASSDVPTGLIRRMAEEATVLVVGIANGGGWRKESQTAGAFACLSSETPPEDRQVMIGAAIKYEEARGEIRELRRNSEQICFELVESFGTAMEKLQSAEGDADNVRESLTEIRSRIVRALL